MLVVFQLLVVFSGLGTYFYGYFFAFHLLNIVNTNELLKSVLKAVTLNSAYNTLLLYLAAAMTAS